MVLTDRLLSALQALHRLGTAMGARWVYLSDEQARMLLEAGILVDGGALERLEVAGIPALMERIRSGLPPEFPPA